MNTETQSLEVVPRDAQNPTALMRQSTDVASVCKDIVVRTACNIQGRKYVKCEGWMAIATAHGCMARSRDVQRIEGGWTAIGEIVRVSDGVLLSTAEGYVGKDEKKWGSCPEYACRAMVQTRAISRACRAAFAHVVVLMDAGLSTTPAEEVPESGFQDERPARSSVSMEAQEDSKPATKSPPSVGALRDKMLTNLLAKFEQPVLREFAVKWGAIPAAGGLIDWRDDAVPNDADDMNLLELEVKKFTDGGEITLLPALAVKPASPPAPARNDPPASNGAEWRSTPITFGKNKGSTLGDLKDASLRWYVNNYEVKKGKYEAENQKFRDALDAAQEEMQFEPDRD